MKLFYSKAELDKVTHTSSKSGDWSSIVCWLWRHVRRRAQAHSLLADTPELRLAGPGRGRGTCYSNLHQKFKFPKNVNKNRERKKQNGTNKSHLCGVWRRGGGEEGWREQSGPSWAKSCLLFKAGSSNTGLRGDESTHRAAALSSAFLQHFQNEASVPQRRRRRRGVEWWGGRAGWGGRRMKAGCDMWTKGEQSHSVAFREKESLGLDLPLPRMIFCSSFCCFWRSCSSFMRSSWIFLCSSTIRNCSSACNTHTNTHTAQTMRSDKDRKQCPSSQVAHKLLAFSLSLAKIRHYRGCFSFWCAAVW